MESEENLYDQVEIEDMKYDSERKLFLYDCPCGDKFRVDLDTLLKETKDKDDGEIVVKCPSCPLKIKILFDKEYLQKFKQ